MYIILKLVSDAGGGASASATENAALREQVRIHFTTLSSFLIIENSQYSPLKRNTAVFFTLTVCKIILKL